MNYAFFYNNSKLVRNVWVAVTFVVIAGMIARPAIAERLESDSYVIQFGNFNTGSGTTDNENFNLTFTTGQTADGPYGSYESANFFLGSGFQYIYQIQNFAFSIDTVAIDFGTLTPNVHETETQTLTITTRGAGGYTIYSYAQHGLRNQADDSTVIPDTTCDSGTCTISSADVWTTESNPGFGFNLTGDTASSDFVSASYFRPFADRSLAEVMQPIMSSLNLATSDEGTVTYKVGITGQQAADNYSTAINYVAVPGY